MSRTLLAAATMFVAACSAGAPSPGPLACEQGFVAAGETCVPRFDDCAEAELPRFGGGCLPIGPQCGAGFRADATGSCAPILPTASCGAGTMAVPGDEACHPVGDCGTGAWGNLPDEPSAKWVDAAAPEGGDGSRERPFRTVAAAIGSVARGGLVGIAAGKYEVNVDIDKPVRIQGRCSSMVELRGAEGAPKDHVVQATSAGVELRDVALTGPYIAVGVYDADVTLERVWIHDTGFTSVEALGYSRPSTVLLRDSLVERGAQVGVYVSGATASLERSEIREVTAVPGTKTGDGVLVRPRSSSGTTHPGKLLVRNAHVHSNLRTGILVLGSALDADGLVVKGTGSPATSTSGPGIVVQKATESPRSTIRLHHAFLAGSTRVQLSVREADAELSHVVAREGVAEPSGINGGGLYFGNDTSFSLADALIENTFAFGVVTEGAGGSIERTIVRDVRTTPSGAPATGIQVGIDKDTQTPSKVRVEQSLVRRIAQVGLLALGAEASVSDVAVLDVTPLNGIFGDGFAANTVGPEDAPAVATLDLRRCLVQRAARAGVTVFGGNLAMHACRLTCNAIDLNVDREYAVAGSKWLAHETFVDADETNTCGCGAAGGTCRAQTMTFTPIGG